MGGEAEGGLLRYYRKLESSRLLVRLEKVLYVIDYMVNM